LHQLRLDTRHVCRDNVLPIGFRLKEVTMKTILAFAICVAIAVSTLCQSTPAPTGKQEKEQQLRTALEQMRDAIDRYHGLFIRGKIMAKAGSQGYPSDLEELVKTTYVDAHGQTIHLLESVPVDPMTGAWDWGLRRRSPPGFIFDVYTKSDGTALDGTKYQNW
jgi:general secretion pathway protein G